MKNMKAILEAVKGFDLFSISKIDNCADGWDDDQLDSMIASGLTEDEAVYLMKKCQIAYRGLQAEAAKAAEEAAVKAAREADDDGVYAATWNSVFESILTKEAFTARLA